MKTFPAKKYSCFKVCVSTTCQLEVQFTFSFPASQTFPLPANVSINEYERQGPAPHMFVGQNHNYLVNFECQPSVQGLAWISPPKKSLKNSKFSSSPSFSSARAVFSYFFAFKSKSFFSSDISSDYTLLPFLPDSAWNNQYPDTCDKVLPVVH